MAVYDSNTEAVMATVPAGTVTEAESAMPAARKAFDGWACLPVEARAGYLDKIALGIKARADELATVIAREVGMPLKLTRAVQVGGPVWHWGNFAKVACNFDREKKVESVNWLAAPLSASRWSWEENQPASYWTMPIWRQR